MLHLTATMNIIDLTRTYTRGMPTYPGDPIPELKPIASIGIDGFVDHLVTTGMHVGTHIDAPLHMIEGGKKISEIKPDRFFGRGVCINAEGVKDIAENVLENVELKQGDIVLVHTGFDKQFPGRAYFEDYPVLTEGFGKALVEAGVSMVGTDTPSPDKDPFVVHKILLSNGVLIIENLTNLKMLLELERFDVVALPTKFDTEASFARVVAMVSEN